MSVSYRFCGTCRASRPSRLCDGVNSRGLWCLAPLCPRCVVALDGKDYCPAHVPVPKVVRRPPRVRRQPVLTPIEALLWRLYREAQAA